MRSLLAEREPIGTWRTRFGVSQVDMELAQVAGEPDRRGLDELLARTAPEPDRVETGENPTVSYEAS